MPPPGATSAHGQRHERSPPQSVPKKSPFAYMIGNDGSGARIAWSCMSPTEQRDDVAKSLADLGDGRRDPRGERGEPEEEGQEARHGSMVARARR